MRALVFANSRLNLSIEIHPDDLIIAADGGARHCLDLGVKPAYVIGDMDSLNEMELARLKDIGSQIIRHSARKDFTDLELALRLAQESGACEIVLLASLGARWDQSIANILLPAGLNSVRIRLIDGNQEINFLRGGSQLVIHGQPGDTVSLIPLRGDAFGVYTHNLEYPLAGENLFFGSTRGISNVMLDDRASITLEEGLLLCILIHLES